jgi:hypothetical protein
LPLSGGFVESTASRAQIPLGIMADMTIAVMRPRGEMSRWRCFYLDAEARPQGGGWGKLLSGEVPAIAKALTPPPHTAPRPPVVTDDDMVATYIEFNRDGEKHRGIVTFGSMRAFTEVNRVASYVYYRWTPLAPGKPSAEYAIGNWPASLDPTYGKPPPGISTGREPFLRAFGGTAADLTGTGRIDLVFVKLDSGYGGYGPHHYWLRMMIGYGLDAKGKVKGWSSEIWIAELTIQAEHSGFAPRISLSVAAAKNVVFILLRDHIWVVRLDGDEVKSKPWSPKWESKRPKDFVRGAIAVADFGGSTGTDLVVLYTTQTGGAIGSAYCVGYDMDQWQEFRWGPDLPAPVDAVDGRLSLLVGGLTEDSAAAQNALVDRVKKASSHVVSRQKRLLSMAVQPEEKKPAVADVVAAAARETREKLDPRATITAGIRDRVTPVPPKGSGTIDRLQPIVVAPRFSQPIRELLCGAFQDWLLPVGSMPDESVTVLDVNQAMIEAILVGMNHEMSRELHWRGFPVHPAATYFRRFWDVRDAKGLPVDDIAAIETWERTSSLGSHVASATSAVTLLFVVRGSLLRRIPNARVYAVRGGVRDSVDLSQPPEFPLLSGALAPGVAFFGFGVPLSIEAAQGTGPSDGWYFVFEEPPTAPWFGVDEPPKPPQPPTPFPPQTWAELDWSHVAPDENGYFDKSPLAGYMPSNDRHRWGFSAAHMAHILLQRPVRFAIHGSQLLLPRADKPSPS